MTNLDINWKKKKKQELELKKRYGYIPTLEQEKIRQYLEEIKTMNPPIGKALIYFIHSTSLNSPINTTQLYTNLFINNKYLATLKRKEYTYIILDPDSYSLRVSYENKEDERIIDFESNMKYFIKIKNSLRLNDMSGSPTIEEYDYDKGLKKLKKSTLINSNLERAIKEKQKNKKILSKKKPHQTENYQISKLSIESDDEYAPEEREELLKTELELELHVKEFTCAVHKGSVSGLNVYVCPKCAMVYCRTCAQAIKAKGEYCWFCRANLEL